MAGAGVLSADNLNTLVGLLQTCLGHDARRKQAEDQLVLFEENPGCCSLLYEVIANKHVSVDVRMLAVSCFKNIVHKYWRTKSPKAVSDEEKAYLRPKLLQLLDEDKKQLATQEALLIAKIARVDFPQYWPNLLEQIMAIAQQSTEIVRLRALETLHHVTATLCTRRLIGYKRQFQLEAPKIFIFLAGLCKQSSETIVNALAQFAGGAVQASQLSVLQLTAEANILCLKVLRRVIVNGFPSFHQNPEVVSFLEMSLAALRTLLDCSSVAASTELGSFVEKAIILHMKLLHQVQDAHPLSYMAFLTPTLAMFFELIKRPTLGLQKTAEERVHVLAMLFLKNVLVCPTYLPDTDHLTPTTAHAPSNTSTSLQTPYGEAHKVVGSFFTPELIKELITTLVGQYFLVTADEFSEWANSPEEFLQEHDGDAWKFKLKPCAETLFVSILQQRQEISVPVVVQLLHHVVMDASATDMSLLLKEAVYNAIGLAHYELYDAIDFADLFSGALSKDLQNPDPRYKIIKRRAVWLIGVWVNKIQADHRPVYYRTLANAMNDSDTVIQLTAVTALKHLVDDLNFYPDKFQEFLDTVVTLLFRMLSKATESETKLRLMAVVEVIITMVGEGLAAHGTLILQALGSLWSQCANQPELNLLKSSIVRTLSCLVNALGAGAQGFYTLLLPVVNYATDVTLPDEVYLLEDGLALWLAVLHMCSTCTEDILRLFPHLPAILNKSYEHVEICLKILETYYLLGGVEFMKIYAASVAPLYHKMLGDMKDQGTLILVKTLVTLIRLFPMEAPALLEGAGVLSKMLHQIVTNAESSLVIVHYLEVFSLIAVVNTSFFVSFLENLSAASSQNLLHQFFEQLFDKFDNFPQTRTKKLACMAGLSMLATPQAPRNNSITFLPLIINAVVGIVPESESGVEAYSELSDQYDEVITNSHSAAEKQLQQLMKTDVVYTTQLQKFVGWKLQEIATIHGQNFQNVMNTIDPLILKGLGVGV